MCDMEKDMRQQLPEKNIHRQTAAVILTDLLFRENKF